MEAQRALLKLGFVCRRADSGHGARGAWVPVDVPDQDEGPDSADADRLSVLEAGLATAMEAIASLRHRVQVLENR
jgi:hypothetical protein